MIYGSLGLKFINTIDENITADDLKDEPADAPDKIDIGKNNSGGGTADKPP